MGLTVSHRPLTSVALVALLFAAHHARAETVETGRYNVLFIAIDDLNDWIGALDGHPQAVTPNLDRLVQSGVYFTNAHCTAPVCAASRNSLLCGLRPSTTGWYTNTQGIRGRYRQVLGKAVPLPQYFRQHGYVTVAGGKIYHKGVADFASEELWDRTKPRYQWPEKYLARGHGYGGKHFYPFPADGGQIYQKYGRGVKGQSLCWAALEDEDIPHGVMPDVALADWAVEQLRSDFEKPFFLAVGFRRPHVPYTAPKKYFDLYRLEEIQVPTVPADELADIPLYGKAMALGTLPGGDHQNVLEIGPDYWREMVRAYLACVSFVDDQVGKVLDALHGSPYAANTVVVLWSDHGQHLGEKRHWRKQCLWEESTRVPLAFVIPGNRSNGHPSKRPVSLLDIYPTLIELCELPPLDVLEGQSLVPLLTNPTVAWDRPAVTTWHYRNHSVRGERWHYIVYRDGSEELYDHDSDPQEFRNLAGQNEYHEIVTALRRWLPKTNTLPSGTSRWEGDKLDRILTRWQQGGGPPAWLQ